MRVLVLGGQRFLGKAFADLLLKDGYSLTLLQKNPFTENKIPGVAYLNADLMKKTDLEQLSPELKWDYVFDFSSQTPIGVQNLIEVLGKRIKKYFYISSVFIYPYGQNLHEAQFDPSQFAIPNSLESLTSVESLRAIEALIAQRLSKQFVIFRVPFLFGPEDPALKIQKLIRKVVAREPVYFPNLEVRFSVLSIEDAAKAILKLSLNPFVGVVNLASSASLRMGLFLKWIENYSYVSVSYAAEASAQTNTSFSLEKDLYFDTSLLKNLGVVIPNSSAYIEELIKLECQNLLDEAI